LKSALIRIPSGSLLSDFVFINPKEKTLDLESVKKAVAAEIEKLTKVYRALGGITSNGSVGAKPRRKMSREAREKIAAAQRKRWAKQRKAA